MKKIETLLNIDLGQKFDTPKKLNRSTKNIPAEITNNLESGLFTCEMISDLAKSFPIYRYRTCITVHGNWGEVERQHIGRYKNIHKNGCGSLEVFYSAIDRNKIKQIRELLNSVGGCELYYKENSTERGWFAQEQINENNFAGLKVQYIALADRLKGLNIYGYVNLYIAASPFGGKFICLDFFPLAIPQSEVFNLVLKMKGMNDIEFTAKQEQVKAAREIEEIQRKAEREASEAASAIERAKEQAHAEILMEQIKHLPEVNDIEKGVLVKVVRNISGQLLFSYSRLDGKGCFGRHKWSKAYSDTFQPALTNLTWQEKKQETSDFFKRFKGYRLAA